MHQNFNKFQNRCTDGNINAPKWIRHLGDAYNIIRKTQKLELPEEWTIARLQEELAKSRDFVTDLSPDHPTLRHELLTDDERRQVEEAFAVHVEGAYYEVGGEGEGEGGGSEEKTPPTLREVCDTVIAWLRTVPTTFISVDKIRRYPRSSNYRGARHHHHSSPHAEFAPVASADSSSSTPASSSSTQGRPNTYQRPYPSYAQKTSPTKPKFPGQSANSYSGNGSSYRRHYNSNFPPHPSSSTSATESQTTTPTNDTLSNNVTQSDAITDTNDETEGHKANSAKISRQVDSSYRLSGNFDTPTTSNSNSEAATDSNNESNDESNGNDSANDSNESNPESPSESSAESSNDHEFAWSSIMKAPREPRGRRELLESQSPLSSEPASEVTSESEPDANQGTSEVPPQRSLMTCFNETSFGVFKRSSLPSPSTPSSTSSPKRSSLPSPASRLLQPF